MQGHIGVVGAYGVRSGCPITAVS